MYVEDESVDKLVIELHEGGVSPPIDLPIMECIMVGLTFKVHMLSSLDDSEPIKFSGIALRFKKECASLLTGNYPNERGRSILNFHTLMVNHSTSDCRRLFH